MTRIRLFILVMAITSLSFTASAKKKTKKKSDRNTVQQTVPQLMSQVRQRIKKLGYNWDSSIFHDSDWSSKGYSVNKQPLIYWSCGDKKSLNRSLVLSAVHGDEVTPTFFGFRLVEWLKANPNICKDKFVVVAPLVNPDGFFRYSKGTRTNYNKVDLNRNFDTPDWAKEAHRRWKLTARSKRSKPQRRYYPGDKAGTEPEIHFQEWLMNEFQPTKIMSVHAPLKFFEFDGPDQDKLRIFARDYINAVESMKKLLRKNTKILRFKTYGTFPGSLGNFAGRLKGIPTVTTELPSSNPKYAARYFGELEKSTRVFLNFDFSKHAEAQTKLSENGN